LRLVQSNHIIGSGGNIEIWISTEITDSDEYAKGILLKNVFLFDFIVSEKRALM
jgi:hypothetical protein